MRLALSTLLALGLAVPALAQQRGGAPANTAIPEVQQNPGNAVGGSPQSEGRIDNQGGSLGTAGGREPNPGLEGANIPEVARNPGNAVGGRPELQGRVDNNRGAEGSRAGEQADRGAGGANIPEAARNPGNAVGSTRDGGADQTGANPVISPGMGGGSVR
jgi:hypothetical protein